MGNCFAFLKKYSLNFYESKSDTYYYNSNSNSISASSVPIDTPIYFDMSNNPYNNHYTHNSNNPTNSTNSNNPNVIVINQQPYYYDNGLGAANGFFTGMLIGELLSNDCL